MDPPDRHRGHHLRQEAHDVGAIVRSLHAGEIDEAEVSWRDLRRELREELLGSDSYVPVFLLTLTIVVLIPFDEGNTLMQVVTTVLAAGTLLLTLRRSHLTEKALHGLSIVGLVAGTLGVAAQLGAASDNTNHLIVAIASALFAVLLAIAIPAILRRVLIARRVTMNLLAGALGAYLLLGLLFATAFRLVYALDANGSSPFFVQNARPASSDFEYFSFITITTVGYGDLTPGNDAARAGAVAEAVCGQVFLVTIVARVVSRLGTERVPIRRRERPDDGDGLDGRDDATDPVDPGT